MGLQGQYGWILNVMLAYVVNEMEIKLDLCVKNCTFFFSSQAVWKICQGNNFVIVFAWKYRNDQTCNLMQCNYEALQTSLINCDNYCIFIIRQWRDFNYYVVPLFNSLWQVDNKTMLFLNTMSLLSELVLVCALNARDEQSLLKWIKFPFYLGLTVSSSQLSKELCPTTCNQAVSGATAVWEATHEEHI